jgi:hypothetical protein
MLLEESAMFGKQNVCLEHIKASTRTFVYLALRVIIVLTLIYHFQSNVLEALILLDQQKLAKIVLWAIIKMKLHRLFANYVQQDNFAIKLALLVAKIALIIHIH